MKHIDQGEACVIVGLIVFGLGAGCCWMSKRSCFPPCKKPATKVVTVERTCKLPPLELPGWKPTTDGCADDHICVTRKEAAKLYIRLARLKDFAIMARTRCDPGPESQPSSQPATSQPSE